MNLIKNFVKFSFGSWIAAAISFFTTPIITLLIVPEEFGRATMFTLTTSIILQVILFGSDQGFMRFFYEINIKERSALLWNSILPSFFIWCVLSLSLFCLWRPISHWLIAEEQFFIVFLLSVNLLFNLLGRYALLVIRMQKKGTFFSIMRIATSILNAIFIVIYCRYVAKSFYAIIWSGILSLVITLVVAIVYEKRIWFSKNKITKNEIIRLLKYGIPFAPASLISILFEGLDKYFLRIYGGFEEMGLYSAAYKIVAILAIVQTGFSMFWTPISFEHYEKNPDDKTLYEDTYKYLLFLITMLGLLLIGCKDLIILIFAKNYKDAASIMPFMIFIPVLYMLTEITCLGVYFKKKSVWQLIIFGILLVVSFCFYILFVPVFKAKGAAMAVALSYIAYFSLRTFVSIRLYPMKLSLIKTIFTLLLLFIIAWINTFINNKTIGISCAVISMLLYLIFNLSTVKELVLYCKNMVIPGKRTEGSTINV